MSFGKFVLGVVVGGSMGALIGLLVAPRKGEETRDLLQHELNERYNESADKVQQSVDQLKDRVREIAEELESIGSQTLEKVTGKASKKA